MADLILTKRKLLYAGLILIGLPVAGCNTLEGVGKDIQKIGEVVEEGAEEIGDEMGDSGN